MRLNIIFVSLIFATLLILAACENSIKEVAAYSNLSQQPVVDAKKVEIMYSDSGVVKVILKASEIRRFNNPPKEPYIEYPQGIHVVFYNMQHEEESNMTANFAIFYETRRLWVAKNNVVAENKKEQKTLNTEELNWDLQKEHFVSDKTVRITSPDEVIVGEGFTANQDFNNWKVKRIKNSYVNLKDE